MISLWCVKGAVNFALMMSQMEGGSPVDYNTITDLFLQVWMFLSSRLFEFVFDQTWFLCFVFHTYLWNPLFKLSRIFKIVDFEHPFVFTIFYQRNMIREATAFLLDVLKPNLPEHAYLQTKVDNQFLCSYS